MRSMGAETTGPVQSWYDQLIGLVAANIGLAEPIVFALCFAESIIVLSLFVPSTVLLLGFGGVHSAAGGQFWPLWLAAATGAFAGDLVTFAFGRFVKRDIAQVWPFRQHRRMLARSRLFFRQWGMLGVIASKFLGVLRPFVPAIAGATHMSWPLFVVASAISALLWAGVLLAPGYGIVSIAK